jgi:hypothetical protein
MGSYQFDGVNDFLSGTFTGFTDRPATLAHWSRITDFSTGRQSPLQIFDASSIDDFMQANIQDNGSARTHRAEIGTDNGEWAAESTTGISIDTWFSGVAVFEGPNDRHSYLDGGNEGTETDGAGDMDGGIDTIWLGRFRDGEFNFTGQMGYAFLWDVALSDTDVADWDNGDIPQQGNLIAAYDLTIDHGGGPIPNVINPGTFDLTISGAAYTGAQTPPVSYDFGGGIVGPFNPPVKNEPFRVQVALEDVANPGSFKVSPTLATGDVKVSKDGGALANIASLPSVEPSGNVLVTLELSDTEMNADVVSVIFEDQTTPSEWLDFKLTVLTTQ